MGIKPSNIEFAQILGDAADLEIVRITHLKDNKIIITLKKNGQELQAVMSVTEVLQCEISSQIKMETPKTRTSRELAQVTRARDWTKEECEANGVPYHYSDKWVLEFHDMVQNNSEITKSTAAYAKEIYNYSSQVMSKAMIRCGIEARPRISEEQKEQARQLLKEGQLSHIKIAQKVGVSKTTINPLARKEFS